MQLHPHRPSPHADLKAAIRTVARLAAALLIATSAMAQDWGDLAIGQPLVAGGHTGTANTLAIRGSGAGIHRAGRDQCHFVCIPREAGDVQIIARLVELRGGDDATAGLMIRSDSAPDGIMVALAFSNAGNRLTWISRRPSGPLSASIALAGKPPLWLKLIRVGRNFAAYKSIDGRMWSMISNNSGGEVAFAGPLQLGCFVAGGDGEAVAAFDSIAIGPAQMPYATSWVGNSFGSRAEDNHVSNTLAAMWVAPDGTCYTSSYWDEAGQPVTSYRDGRVVRALPIGTPQTAEGGITGDATSVYVAAVDRIQRVNLAAPGGEPQHLALSVNLHDATAKRCVVSGLASNGTPAVRRRCPR